MHRHDLVTHVIDQAMDIEPAVDPVINPITQTVSWASRRMPPSRIPLGNEDVGALFIYDELFQRAWWWTGNILAGQIITTIVAGAPEQTHIEAILHDAIEVGAGGGESSEFTGRSKQNYPQLLAEAKGLGLMWVGVNLFAAEWQFDLRNVGFNGFGRNQKTEERIKDSRQ